MKTFPVKSGVSQVLSMVLPTEEQTWLLRACLYTGEFGRQAWTSWLDHILDPLEFLNQETQAIRSLMPFLFRALHRNHVELDKALLTFLRTAQVREEVRNQTYRGICKTVLSSFSKKEIPFMVLKDAALGETLYMDSSLRHCHDIDLLLEDSEHNPINSLQPPLGFGPAQEKMAFRSKQLEMIHQSGLTLSLRSRLFRIPYYHVNRKDLWARSESRIITEVPVRILSPADNLLHVCGEVFSGEDSEALFWACDAWLLINRHPNLDWDVVVHCAEHCHLALPLSVTLGYLEEALEAPIPTHVLNRIYDAASKTNVVGREVALFGLQPGKRGGVWNFMLRARGWGTRFFILKWMLFPSRDYVRLIQQAQTTWAILFYYIYRPLIYLANHLWLRNRRGIRLTDGEKRISPTGEN